MSDALAVFGMLLIYKLAILLVGVLSIYMGFRLFLADKVAPAGDLSANSGAYALQLRGGAPGVFFLAVRYGADLLLDREGSGL